MKDKCILMLSNYGMSLSAVILKVFELCKKSTEGCLISNFTIQGTYKCFLTDLYAMRGLVKSDKKEQFSTNKYYNMLHKFTKIG